MAQEFQFVLDWGGAENTARVLTQNGHRSRSKPGKFTTVHDIYNWKRAGRGVPGWAMLLILELRQRENLSLGPEVFQKVDVDECQKASA